MTDRDSIAPAILDALRAALPTIPDAADLPALVKAVREEHARAEGWRRQAQAAQADLDDARAELARYRFVVDVMRHQGAALQKMSADLQKSA